MPKRYAFTPEQTADMVRRYSNGETCQAIAKDFGVRFEVTRRVLEVAGVYERGRRFSGRYSEAQKQEMTTRYLAGESQAALAADFGCDRINVRHILIRRGVSLRRTRVAAMTDEDEATLRDGRSAGKSFALIASDMELPAHRVLMWARALGISDFKGKTGAESPFWRGGRTHHNGYDYVRVSADDPLYCMAGQSGYALEHRLVMARSLDRPLTKTETVHHINGDRTDNRLENLQIRHGQHGKHAAFRCLDCGSHNIEAAPLP